MTVAGNTRAMLEGLGDIYIYRECVGDAVARESVWIGTTSGY